MKIACFTDAYLPNVNGVSFSVDVFSRRLAGLGNEVEIYAPAFEGTGRVEKNGRVTVRRYYSVPIPTYKDSHLTLPDVVKIYNQVEKFDPDVIHIQTPGTLGLTGILTAKMLKRPVVGTYHTLISEVLVYASLKKSLGKYLRVIDKVISGVKADLGILEEGNGSAKGKGESIPQRITWSAVNRVYGYCDVVICPSEAIKRELEKRGVKRRIEVVSNGVDLAMFKAKKDYRLSLRVVHAGRLGFEKNVDVVIKAFARVTGQLPKAELVIAGDGPATGELKDLSRKLGIEKRVKFLGMIKREKLAGIYRSGDVFATASTMETQGMVVLEAMACGLPVIGVRKYALPDLVHEGENGFVVRPGNERQMAAKMAELLSNPVLTKRMGIKSIEFVQKHEVGIMAKRLESLYMRAIADKAAGGE